jgi:hypothetical protein|tara:strand:- start:455 stop:703 length:249 start_codon:yes stop_codon:yes gene_type:complete
MNKNRKTYHVPKPKKWTFDYILNRIGVLIGLGLILTIILCLSSCGSLRMTEQDKITNYEIDKLWLEYNYKRDSILIEHNKLN